MNTKMNAIAMTLLMIASALAGCTSGDPDGDGTSGIDMEILNEMIDDNLQDFINNTSVTVNQEIHYHNNTTYIVDDGTYHDIVNNNFNNTTNVDGGEVENNNYDQSDTTYNIGGVGGASFGEGVNGSVSGGGLMFVTHLEFTGLDMFPDYETPGDPQDNDFTYIFTYYDYITNSQRTDTFTYPCSVFYVVGSQSSNNSSQVSWWQDNNNYYNAWEQMYNSTIADMFQEAAQTQSIEQICNDEFTGTVPLADGTDEWNHIFFSIDIPEGYAIEYIQLETSHTWFGCYNRLNYDSCTNSDYHSTQHNQMHFSYSEGVYPDNSNHPLYGGWANITIDFSFGFTISETYGVGYGYSSVWPTSEYEFTLYYRFVPVIPIE